ncbi:phenylalanine--tRNA ligase subunit alpha, partial [candidate division FCPU426 bacterium]|nr:phenylalanine--tRNA ligase subunit alpha [candidate division FCPU426 bacterium]
MKEQLQALYLENSEAVQQTGDIQELEEIRIRVLGRKGKLTQVLHGLKDLPAEERRSVGQTANDIKDKLTQAIEQRRQELKKSSWAEDSSLKPDPTLPGRPAELGGQHILNRTLYEIEDIFRTMGFAVAEGPEVETDYYNFEAMNFPPDHPSRDMHDTLFISDRVLLRTHTSPVQVRYMEKQKPPIRAIMPGKTYRCDDDATHSPMFHQVEGLMIDHGVSFAGLKAVLTLF